MNKPYIIAEVGSNWSDFNDCKISIEKAKECGADAVKFQLFDHKSLYGMTEKEKLLKDPDKNPFVKMLPDDTDLEYALPHDWLLNLSAHCHNHNIDFMCTAFSPELIDVVDPYVKAHKVASAEMCHVRMLEKLNQIGKPVYLSTGAHSLEEISDALKYLNRCKVTLMYCVAAYPARYTDTLKIPLIRKLFNLPVGYSDHSLDVIESPQNAIKAGAVAIEKHVNFVNHIGPDSPHSLNEKQFIHMMGGFMSLLIESPDEHEMVSTHNRRLIATKDIQAGDQFIENVNFGIYRGLKPTAGASPFDIDKFLNKTSNRNIKTGEGLLIDYINNLG